MLKKIFRKNNKQQNDIQINTNKNNSIKEENNFYINITKLSGIVKIEISDYISITDLVDKIKSSNEYQVLDLLCNCVLWDSHKQKVNKGIYYVITIDNRIYNILINDEKIIIDERTQIRLDKESQKENITEERVITIELKERKYHYFSAKHSQNGSTYYTKYYDKNIINGLENLELSGEETFNEINLVFNNIEEIEGINNILDIELLKIHILEDLKQNRVVKIKKI